MVIRFTSMHLCFIWTLLLLFGVQSAFSQSLEAKFSRITEAAGIRFAHQRAVFAPQYNNIMPWLTAGGAGIAVGDYNNDGLDDIYLTTSLLGNDNHLYRNDGGFRFTEVATAMGLAKVNSDRLSGTSSHALWLDFNNDGWLDLFLLRFGMTALFENDRGQSFKEVTTAAGVLRRTNSMSAVAFDYDNDGDVDIYIGGYFPELDLNSERSHSKVLFDSWETARNGARNYLFRNNNNGTFTDVTDEAGVADSGWAMAVGHADINNDGWQDIYIANDFGTDILFKNLGQGKFKDISVGAIGVDSKKGMNTDFGDYNNDGFVDIYVTNMTEPYLHECNMLWRNNGNETFTDVSQEARACDTDWGWGAKFADFNNDGMLDIYAANGFISAGEKDYMEVLLNFIFREDIDLRDAVQWPRMAGQSMAGYERNVLLLQSKLGFHDVSKAAGVDSIRDSRGVAVSDLNGDGRLEILVSNVGAAPELYQNVVNNAGHWVAFSLRSDIPAVNRFAIGTKIEISVGGKKQYREVTSASGFNAQSSLVVHFGVDKATKIDEAKISWPNGVVERHQNLQINKLHQLVLRPAVSVR